MDALPFPPRPNLEQYRKRAKDLVKACKSADPDALRAWSADWLEALVHHEREPLTEFGRASVVRALGQIEARVNSRPSTDRGTQVTCTLADAQLLIAQAHGFDRWPEFAKHVDALGRDAATALFESAADAIVSGQLPTLEALVRASPELVRARSARAHRVTLLHYVAANGVEDFRQRSPKNAPAIARFLLAAGAEVDAIAATYGGGNPGHLGNNGDQTTLNLLVSSAHPALAGVQVSLVETLLDFGAAVNGLQDNGSPLLTALAFGYGSPAEALVSRGARIDNVYTAAALGRVDLVAKFLVPKTGSAPKSTAVLTGLRWPHFPKESDEQAGLALVWACKFRRTAVVRLLLERGVDPATGDHENMTALHWASANGLTDVVTWLLARGAPLEARNRWGGTVLGSTVYCALERPVEGVDYPAMIEALVAAGANASVVSLPTGNGRIDQILRRSNHPRKADP